MMVGPSGSSSSALLLQPHKIRIKAEVKKELTRNKEKTTTMKIELILSFLIGTATAAGDGIVQVHGSGEYTYSCPLATVMVILLCWLLLLSPLLVLILANVVGFRWF